MTSLSRFRRIFFSFFMLRQVEANHVFLLEPLLNAAVEAQAVNRVHRGGQTRPTTIHRFIVRGTIEEDIERWGRLPRLVACRRAARV